MSSDNLTIPAVMAYGYTRSKKFPSVVVNDVQGAYMVTNYIIQQGHKRIAVITGKDQSFHTKDRLLGYQKALYDNKIFYNPELVIDGDWSKESGYNAAAKAMEQNVTAIFCMNDQMAGGVYKWLMETGKTVGKDISIAGYDDRDVSLYMNPLLTTLKLPLHQIGKTACQLLINQIEGDVEKDLLGQKGGEIIIQEEGQLKIRDSVMALQ